MVRLLSFLHIRTDSWMFLVCVSGRSGESEGELSEGILSLKAKLVSVFRQSSDLKYGNYNIRFLQKPNYRKLVIFVLLLLSINNSDENNTAKAQKIYLYFQVDSLYKCSVKRQLCGE